MTLLTTVRAAARRLGIASPNAVATATDATTLALLEYAQEEGEELARFGDWKALRREKTFTTVAAETQTDTPIPSDFAGFIDDTFWNRSARRKLRGPLSSQEWQHIKATSTPGVTDSFYIRGTSWLMAPTPTAGQTIAYEYRTKNFCTSSGGTAQSAWAADTDLNVLEERLVSKGIIWRFKKGRRMDWEVDYEEYLTWVNDALSKDNPGKILDMSGGGSYSPPRYGAGVPDSSWNL